MLRVFTTFSGYDSQCLAINRLGIEYDLVGWSEIDQYAIMAHNVLFPQFKERNYGNICDIDWSKVPDFDLFTYSSPCQDITSMGNGKGLEENSGTRSSLLWYCKNAIIEKHPKFLLMENVSAIVNSKFKPYFDKWVDFLSEQGYYNKWAILDAVDYGVPQRRKRLFLLSSLKPINEDPFHPDSFTYKTVRDILEDDVDDNLWLDKDKADTVINRNIDKIKTLSESGYNPVLYDDFNNRITKDQNNVGTLTRNMGIKTLINGHKLIYKDEDWWKIRPYTQNECMTLMGLTPEEAQKLNSASSGISSTQIFKLLGNSIVVDCMIPIFRYVSENNC